MDYCANCGHARNIHDPSCVFSGYNDENDMDCMCRAFVPRDDKQVEERLRNLGYID